MTWKIGKKYRHRRGGGVNFGNVFTCEAILSNGDVAVTWPLSGVVYSAIFDKRSLGDYEEVPEEDWRAIFRDDNGELSIGICSYKSEQSVIDAWGTGPGFIKAVKVSP